MREKLTLNEENAHRVISTKESLLIKYGIKPYSIPNLPVRDNQYDSICDDYISLAVAKYGLTRDVQQFRRAMAGIIAAYVPWMKHRLEYREEHGLGKDYDYGAVADLDFARPMGLFVAVSPREEIAAVCAKTNYGRYRGKPRLNSFESAFVRLYRAFFLDDKEWLEDEIASLSHISGSRDSLCEAFIMPKGMWPALLAPLFEGKREEFQSALKKACSWNRGRVRRRMKEYGIGGYYSSECINPVLQSALKIAMAYKGWDIKIDDELLPYDVLLLE